MLPQRCCGGLLGNGKNYQPLTSSVLSFPFIRLWPSLLPPSSLSLPRSAVLPIPAKVLSVFSEHLLRFSTSPLLPLSLLFHFFPSPHVLPSPLYSNVFLFRQSPSLPLLAKFSFVFAFFITHFERFFLVTIQKYLVTDVEVPGCPSFSDFLKEFLGFVGIYDFFFSF